MSKDIYVAGGLLLKKIIKTPIILLILVLLMSTGFLAVKTKPVRALGPHGGSVCPDGSVKFEVGQGYEYSDGSGTVAIHSERCGHNSASWEAAECYAITGVCIKIGGPGGGSLIDGLSQGGGPFAYDISHVVLTTSYTCEPQECPEEQLCPDTCHTDTIYIDDGDCGRKECLPNAPVAGTCPTECDYQGGTVNDGSCGTIDCPATNSCEDKPTSIPSPTPTPSPTGKPPVGGPGPAGPPVCGAATPTAPHLISATAIGGNKVKLKWSKVNGASHYSIYYGPSSGNYLYGVPDTGDTDNFIIEGMSGGCFAVRAVDDCAPSEASNEVCIGAVGGVGQVLGLSATSGNDVNPVYFWGGILSLLFGTRILTQELQRKRLK